MASRLHATLGVFRTCFKALLVLFWQLLQFTFVIFLVAWYYSDPDSELDQAVRMHAYHYRLYLVVTGAALLAPYAIGRLRSTVNTHDSKKSTTVQIRSINLDDDDEESGVLNAKVLVTTPVVDNVSATPNKAFPINIRYKAKPPARRLPGWSDPEIEYIMATTMKRKNAKGNRENVARGREEKETVMMIATPPPPPTTITTLSLSPPHLSNPNKSSRVTDLNSLQPMWPARPQHWLQPRPVAYVRDGSVRSDDGLEC